MAEQEGIELNSIILVIRHRIWLFVVCVVATVAAAIIFTVAVPPTYDASVTLLVQPAQETSASEYSSLVAAERLALTYSEMIEGELVLNPVILNNNLEVSPSSLARRVTAAPIPNTQLIRLTVRDTSPQQAAILANAIAEEFTKQVQSVQMERYGGSLANMQEKMDSLSAQMADIQSQIQSFNTLKIDHEVALSQAESLLAEQQTNYRAFQEEYQRMQMTIATLPEKLSISEAARPLSLSPSNTAVVTFLHNQADIASDGNYSVQTYGKMIVSAPILEAAIQQTGLQISADVLAQRVSLVSVPGTQLIELRVINSDINRAIQLADAIAQVFIKQIRDTQQKPYVDNMNRLQGQIDTLLIQTRETQDNIVIITNERLKVVTEISTLESQLSEARTDFRTLQQDYNQTQLSLANAQDSVVVTEQASAPDSSTRNSLLYIFLGGVVGLLGAFGITFFIEYMNNVVRSPEDIRRVTDISTLGSIGMIKEPEGELIVLNQPRSPIAEAFRVLATNIRLMGLDRPLRTIMITSPHAQEGKSLIVANLAVLFAQRELKLITVDADLRLPRMHHLYGLDQENGLTDSLIHGKPIEKLKTVSVDRLRVLTSGNLPANPAEVLASARMRNLIDDLVKDSDLVIIDCPPVLPVADASILASLVDGVILVVRADRTRSREMRDAIDNLRKVGGRLLGVVLNGVPSRSDTYSYYYGERLGKKSFDPIKRFKEIGSKLPSLKIDALFGKNNHTRQIEAILKRSKQSNEDDIRE